MARPSHKPTAEQRRQVTAMRSYGTPEADIAKVLGISTPTLRKYYRAELDTAMAKSNAMVAESLFQQARKGNVTAMIFWLKCRARWRENAEPERFDEAEGDVVIRRSRPDGSVYEVTLAKEAAPRGGPRRVRSDPDAT
jgi:AcrR family transcriptional regulator